MTTGYEHYNSYIEQLDIEKSISMHKDEIDTFWVDNVIYYILPPKYWIESRYPLRQGGYPLITYNVYNIGCYNISSSMEKNTLFVDMQEKFYEKIKDYKLDRLNKFVFIDNYAAIMDNDGNIIDCDKIYKKCSDCKIYDKCNYCTMNNLLGMGEI